MKRELIIRAVAGGIMLLSAILTLNVSIYWIWLGVFVGANLLQSAFTRFCPLEWILKKLNVGA
jgi:hypothetical protein